jgi:hypothetical protein
VGGVGEEGQGIGNVGADKLHDEKGRRDSQGDDQGAPVHAGGSLACHRTIAAVDAVRSIIEFVIIAGFAVEMGLWRAGAAIGWFRVVHRAHDKRTDLRWLG